MANINFELMDSVSFAALGGLIAFLWQRVWLILKQEKERAARAKFHRQSPHNIYMTEYMVRNSGELKTWYKVEPVQMHEFITERGPIYERKRRHD